MKIISITDHHGVRSRSISETKELASFQDELAEVISFQRKMIDRNSRSAAKAWAQVRSTQDVLRQRSPESLVKGVP